MSAAPGPSCHKQVRFFKLQVTISMQFVMQQHIRSFLFSCVQFTQKVPGCLPIEQRSDATHNQLACVKETRRNSHCKCSFQTLAWGEKASWKLGAGLCCPEQGRRWPGPFNGEAQRFLEPRRANVSWDFPGDFKPGAGVFGNPPHLRERLLPFSSTRQEYVYDLTAEKPGELYPDAEPR